MSRGQDSRGNKGGGDPSSASRADAGGAKPASPDVQAGGWVDAVPRARWKSFPGPRTTGDPLRVSFSRQPYADLISHAKESLDAEVCGVLIGEFCEDDGGPFVSVDAAIRGTSAREGSAHVTFTQETWNHIHEVKERDYSKLQIIGWYHSHPGFGVEFSEMDLFIHRNFFPGAAQIAYVIDPLGGAEAICVNLPEGVRPLSRFWVDGRERTCRATAPASAGDHSGGPGAPGASALLAVETRLGQLIQAVDEQHRMLNRYAFGVAMLLASGIIIATTYTMYRAYTRDLNPPELQSYMEVPVKIGDHTALVGLSIVGWKLPPELNAIVQEQARLQLEAEKKAREEAEKAKKPGPAASPGTPAPTSAPAGQR